MKELDRYLQKRRIDVALPWISPGSHVLDVGCADGMLFKLGGDRIASGVGIDTKEYESWFADGFEQRVGDFPEALSAGEAFDAVAMLAVVEHVALDVLARWAAALPGILRVGGRVVITTPSPKVDHVLHIGGRLGVIDGMEAHEHHGFDPRQVPGIFGSAGLRLEHRRRFELGLNNLFVFAAPNAPVSAE